MKASSSYRMTVQLSHHLVIFTFSFSDSYFCIHDCFLKSLWWYIIECTGLLPILASMIPEADLCIRQNLALCFKYFSGNLALHHVCICPLSPQATDSAPFLVGTIIPSVEVMIDPSVLAVRIKSKYSLLEK